MPWQRRHEKDKINLLGHPRAPGYMPLDPEMAVQANGDDRYGEAADS